jgi:large conductance mechanosensitive channel
MFKEFKEFAMKGNIIDLAIGVIIGGAFQKIVTSLVNDVIMPIISILTGKVNYEDWVIKIKDISIGAGLFLTTIINFLIIALTIFLVIKYINKLNKKLEKIKMEEFNKLNKKLGTDKIFKRKNKKEEPEEEPTTKICPYCLSEINIKSTRCKFCTSKLEQNK